MSTKIYDAYKLKKASELPEVLDYIEKRARREIKDKLKALYWEYMIHIDPDREPDYHLYRQRHWSDDKARLRLAHDQIMAKFKGAHIKPYRDRMDLTVYVVVYLHKKQVYLRAVCDHVSALGGSLDFLKRYNRVEDYYYQNQTDPPENVPTRQWKRRSQVWHEILQRDSNALRLDLCTWESFSLIDPHFDLWSAYTKDPPKIPSLEEVYVKRLQPLRPQLVFKTRPGHIFTTPRGVSLRKRDDNWTVVVGKKRHTDIATLEDAVEQARYHLMPQQYRDQIDRMIANL